MNIKKYLTLIVLNLFFCSLVGCWSLNAPVAQKSLSDMEAPHYDWTGLSSEYDPSQWNWLETYFDFLLHAQVLSYAELARPYETIKQGEFLNWLHRIADFLDTHSDKNNANQNFIDSLFNDHPYYPSISWAFDKGIVNDNENFVPDDPLIRANAAKWIIRAKGGAILETQALENSHPVIFAQDGHKDLSFEIRAIFSLVYAPEHQLMSYRWRVDNEFRWIEPYRSLNKGEAAFSLYKLIHPPRRGGSLSIGTINNEKNQSTFHETFTLPLTYAPVISKKDQHWSHYPILIQEIPTIENGGWKIFDDGRMKITFHFRKGLKWSDGYPLNAHDAVFAFNNLHKLPDKDSFSEFSEWIESVEAIDDYTFRSYWKQPYLKANKFIHVLPFHMKEFYEDIAKPSNYPPTIHAGPFFLQKNGYGDYIFRANTNYALGSPLIKTIQIIKFNNEINLIDALIDNKIDLIWGQKYDPNFSLRLGEQKDSFSVFLTPSLSWEHVSLNIDHPFLADLKVRKALLLSIDRKLLTTPRQKVDYPASGWLPSDHPAFNKEQLPYYEFDMEKASLFMEKAGWKLDPEHQKRKKDDEIFTITLITPQGHDYREKNLTYIASQWEKLGLEVVKLTVDPEIFFNEVLGKRSFDGATACIFAWHFTPESNLYTLTHSTMVPSPFNNYIGQNYSAISHPFVDELSLRIFRELNPVHRYLHLGSLHLTLMEELPALPLFHYGVSSIAQPHLKGYSPSILLHPPFCEAFYWHMEH